MSDNEWSLLGYIFVGNVQGTDKVKIFVPLSIYEMQLCYLEPILRKFSLVIDGEMNSGFDYLTRLEEIERVMKSKCNSEMELILKGKNEQLLEKIKSLEEEVVIMRKAVTDAKIREPIIFDAV